MSPLPWISLVMAVGLVSCAGPQDVAAPPNSSPSTVVEPPVESERPVVASPAAEVAPQRIRDRVEHRFDLPSPDWLAATAGAVWVKRDDGVVNRIDPATNRITATIDVKGTGLCQGLGAGEDTVWTCVGPDAVGEIDASSGELVTRLKVAKITDQSYIPVVADHVWFLIDGGTTLAGVHLGTRKIDVEVPLDANCTDLGNDDDAIWAACVGDDTVIRVDLTTRNVTARVAGLYQPRRLSVADQVWVSYADGVARIDSESAEVTGAIDVGTGLDGGLHATRDAVWMRTGGTFLRGVDPDTMELVEVITAPEASGGSVLAAFGSLWASAYDDTVVYRLRPRR